MVEYGTVQYSTVQYIMVAPVPSEVTTRIFSKAPDQITDFKYDWYCIYLREFYLVDVTLAQ